MQASQAIVAGLGPLAGQLNAPVNAAPLTGTGILNLANLGAAAVKVLGPPASGPRGAARRCKIVCVTAGVNIAWATRDQGQSAPVFTALGAGAATEGSLIIGGGGAVEWITILDTQDLYLIASAANTVINLTVVEST